MGNIFVERRRLPKHTPLSWDIVHHLYGRFHLNGLTFIITENPSSLLAALKKQWLKILYQLQRERASTLSKEKQDGILRAVYAMQGLQFIIFREPILLPDRGVVLLRPEEWSPHLPLGHTMYITLGEFFSEDMEVMHHGVIVTYM